VEGPEKWGTVDGWAKVMRLDVDTKAGGLVYE
jgi:hypothetical protein